MRCGPLTGHQLAFAGKTTATVSLAVLTVVEALAVKEAPHTVALYVLRVTLTDTPNEGWGHRPLPGLAHVTTRLPATCKTQVHNKRKL
jgi:hypothetical protein